MKLIYIAGPFRAPTGYEVEQNIRRAEEFILPLAELGALGVCPHSMLRNFAGTMTDDFWLRATRELMEGCHAAIFEHNWQQSEGSIGEHGRAHERRMPVFHSLGCGHIPGALVDWLKGENDG